MRSIMGLCFTLLLHAWTIAQGIPAPGALLASPPRPGDSLRLAPADSPACPLGEMVVTGSRFQALLESDQSIVVIHSKDWEGRGKSLPDVLQECAGVQTRQYGGLGSFQTVSIRGMDGSKVLVYLDDVPLNSGSGAAVDLGKIDMGRIETVEIYKSLIPARFGGNGVAGVIHLISKKDGGGPCMQVSSTVGSHGLQEYAASYRGAPYKNVSLFTQVSYAYCKNDFTYTDQNYTPYDPANWTTRTRANSQYQDFSALGGLSYKSDNGNIAELSLSYASDGGGIPGNCNQQTKTAGFDNEEVRLHASYEVRQWSAKGWTAKAGLDYMDASARTHWTPSDSLDFVRGNLYADFGADDRMLMPFAGLSYFPASYAWFELYLLGDMEDLDPLSYPGNQIGLSWRNQRQSLTESMDGHFTFGKLELVAGLHNETFHDVTGGGADPFLTDTVAASQSLDDEQSGGLGLDWRPCDDLSLFANAGRYYLHPSLNEKYGGGGGVLPNPGLLPENGVSAECGIKYCSGANYLETTGFYKRNADAITYELSGDMIKPFNTDRTLTRGIECNAVVKAASYLSCESHITWQNALNISSPFYDTTKRLPNEPDFSFLLKPTLGPFHGFSLQYTFDYKSGLFRDGANLQEIPPQALHHATLQWRYNDHVTARFTVKNITNTYYEEAYSWFPFPGRQYFVNLTLSL